MQIHIDEMRPGGFIIFDNTDEKIPAELRRDDINWYEIPIGKIAKEDLGLELVRNTVSIGVIAALIGMDMTIVRRDVTNTYKRKGEKVVDINLRAVEAGENYIKEHYASTPSGYDLKAGVDGDRLIMMGNDAIAYGLLVGGCRFMAGYPITPATDVLDGW